LRGFGKLAIENRHFCAQDKALLIFGQGRQLIGQLLAARLHGEIALPQGNNGLARIGILDDQVAGIAREVVVFKCTPGAFTGLDQFPRLEKMISDT
jgi:hypothetical protein